MPSHTLKSHAHTSETNVYLIYDSIICSRRDMDTTNVMTVSEFVFQFKR